MQQLTYSLHTHVGCYEELKCAGTSYGNVVFKSFLDVITVHSRFFEKSSGSSMVSWCYWVDPDPPFRLPHMGVSRFEGFLRYWVL